MAKKFLTSIDLSRNELLNAVVQNLATLPTGIKGLMAFDTTDNELAVHNGSAWIKFQHLDADLTAIAALTGTSGLLRKTAANTWSLDTNAYLTGNQTITITGDATGSGATSIALTLANSGVTAGTYNNVATQVRPFTVDSKGRITGIGTAVTITPAWGSITSKPTTIAGYGITDAYTKTEVNSALALKLDKSVFDDLFEKVEVSTGVYAIKAKYNFYSVGEVSAYGAGTVGGGGGVTALSALTDVSLISPASGNVLIFNGTHWENKPQSVLVPDLSAYAQKTYVDSAIANLVSSAPGTLDTLNELAAALGNDPDFATTITNMIASKEPAIAAGTTAQYWRGDKTWQTLNTAAVPESSNLYFSNARVLATTLAGYAVGTNAALAATDTVLGAFCKVQAQINTKLDASATAVSATKIATARNFSIGGSTGLSAAAVSFDGTANVVLTLAGTLGVANGGTGLTDAKGGFTRKVVGTFSTSATSYAITHNLNSDVVAQVIDTATKEVVECDIVMTNANSVTFTFNVAPAANAYRYIIVG